jgi:hypothetical protein
MMMTISGFAMTDRRMAIGGGLALAAGLALPLRQSRTVTQRGMVGGGLARFEPGEASFSLFVSRLIFSGDIPEVVVGSIIWVDNAAKLTLKSTAITEYIVPEVQPAQGTLRRIIGTMSVNDEGDYPFELEVTDVDLPGSGKDLVVLNVGDGARTGENATPVSDLGFTYVANGMVSRGDIQELDAEIDLTTGVVRPAED